MFLPKSLVTKSIVAVISITIQSSNSFEIIWRFADSEQVAEVAEDEVEIVSPEEDMDELLENAFLRACKLSAKKVEFPILSSNFYRLHIVNSCPPGMFLLDKKVNNFLKS